MKGLLSQGILTLCAALGAFILLLLAGTEILNWYWLVPIPLAAAAGGIYRARRSLPSAYGAARLLDRRLGLADTLSTAVHFSRSQAGPADVRRCQFEQAARLARTVDARQAIPYTLPRSMYPLAALALVASSLFTLRYGLSRRLDLKAPLAHILQQQLGLPLKTVLARNTHRDPESTLSSDDGEEPSASDPAPQASTQPPGDSTDSSGQPRESGDREDPQAENRSDSEEGQNRGSPNSLARKSSANSPDSARRDSGSNQDSTLLSKMKDAFQNLLSRIRPRLGNSGSQEQSALNQNSRQPGRGRENGGKQQSASGQRDRQGGPAADPSGEARQDAADSLDKSAGRSDSRESGHQSGSGIGSEDGDKRIKEAEQLAAMGKISEIIGKRSANITGQATLEVQSTSQQLHTPYAMRDAEHTQAGAEIGRDEIPVALQSYVERYFEQLRKQPAQKK